ILGTVNAGDYNLVQDPTHANLSGTNNITGQEPVLAPLAYYGGTTLTYALRAGSPAIDKGSNDAFAATNLPLTDQPGKPRVVDGDAVPAAVIDIGAVERQASDIDPTLVVTTLADENDGTADPSQGTGTSLREAINAANTASDDDVIVFAVTGKIKLAS